MAAITYVGGGSQRHELLETIAITNQATDTVTVSKAVPVPAWANSCTFVIVLTMTGTSPLFDFILKGANVALGTPDDTRLYDLGGWDGITQKTAATASVTTIDVGPLLTADDSGSATASDRYGVQAYLPEVIVYQYTTDGTTDDEDYSATISVYFRR